jgi:transglutaminase-like putative cysteine protease
LARTLVFSAGLGALVAWNWGRLEEPTPSVGPFLLMIALGIAPVLIPRVRWKFRAGAVGIVAAEVVAVLAAASIALHVDRPYHLGRLAGRAGSGFVDFYDVLVPFNGPAHPLMHGVLLLAVCVFTLLCALAVAARRPVPAIVALAAGAGWPATILPGSDDLGRGAFLLAAALALVAWLRPEGRRAPPQVLTGTALVILALIVSSSGSVAKGQFLGWQNWELYVKHSKPRSVEYIWRANYDGIKWPKERTRVFTVRAPHRFAYWRATTLDAFANDRWDEDLIAVSSIVLANPVDLSKGDPLVPAEARDSTNWKRVDVRIDALRDQHLVGPSQPVAYDSGSVENVQYERNGAALAFAPLTRGDEYSVWGYSPQPTPAQLAQSPADYPPEISLDGRFLRLGHSNAAPVFGTLDHRSWAGSYFSAAGPGRRYEPLYAAAQRIAGKATNPYAATVALEAWFRSSGGFTYDEQPPHGPGAPPLVQFVTKTKSGYCQHFAGAMALMLRYLGIPARVAAGFTSGHYDAKRGDWTVYDRDAHTWVEVWFQGYGWLPFDPTPSRGTLGGSYTSSSFSFDAKGAVKVLGTALHGRSLLAFKLGNLGQEGRVQNNGGPSSTPDGGPAGQDQRSRGLGTGAFLLLGLLALGALLVLAKVLLRRSRFLTRDPRRVAGACRREVVDFLLDQGIEVPHSVAPRELGTLLGKRAGVEATDFAEALGLARFGPISTASAAARESRRELRAVRRRLRQALPLGGRVRGLFSLRSLLANR